MTLIKFLTTKFQKQLTLIVCIIRNINLKINDNYIKDIYQMYTK